MKQQRALCALLLTISINTFAMQTIGEILEETISINTFAMQSIGKILEELDKKNDKYLFAEYCWESREDESLCKSSVTEKIQKNGEEKEKKED